MTVISKSKIPPWTDVFSQIEDIVSNQTDAPFCVSIPYGLQLQKHLWNPERLRVVRHVKNGTGHSFISHHGVGKKNEINIWKFSKEKQPGNLADGIKSVSTDLKFVHILFSQRRWVYITYCNDLSIRVFSAKFCPVSTTSVNKTVLSLAYNEIRDEIVTGVAGGIMTWKFSVGQKDPLIPGQLISCSFKPFDWVMSLTIDNMSKQILAISDVRISMIDLHKNTERCFFQKKCDFSFTTCVFYNPASFFITGDKNGSIRAWSTSLNGFPLVTQFLGEVWNFDTCAQTFKLETGEEVINMKLLSDDLLYYHSHHHIKIWSLNLFHSLFTALSSRIRKCTRIKSPGYPSRVLVHAEDGGVRLVSPVHGYELTTLLPMTTMATDVVDVAHDPRQEKIYLVLGTREVLVFESDTNPCCAHQLWMPDSPDEGVCSLALVNAEFALHENELPLQSGLLFAGHFNGQISLISGKDVYMREKIQAHRSPITFLRVSASCTESRDSLASRDHLISCGTDCTVKIWQLIHLERNQVSILQVALVKLLQAPRDLAMAGNTLCLATTDNNVIMCRVQADEKRKISLFNTSKKSHEFLMHSKDEGHSALINGLSCCSTLGLFATSSEDQYVKIWNTDNQLVREMCFDDSLCGVCFANSRGDILVGFQSHISLVTILNYLPLSYLEILSRMNFDDDPFEDQVQFDDLLKFWYDPQRVPRMHLEANKRKPLEFTEIKRPKKRKNPERKEPVIVKTKQDKDAGHGLFQQKSQSRRLSTKIHVMMALRRLSKISSKKSLKKMANSILEKQDEPAKIEDSQNLQSPEPLPVKKETPKIYWPCAPDGFIPNSVVRKFVKRHEKSDVEAEEKKDEEGAEDLKTSDFWNLWKSLQESLVKQKEIEESYKRKKEAGKAKRRKGSKLGRRLDPRPQTGTSTSEEPLTVVEEEDEEEEIKEEEDEDEDEEQEVVEQEESNQSPETSPESNPVCSPMEIQESPEIFVQESDEEETDVDVSGYPSSETDSVDSVTRLETTSNTHLLSRIRGKDWYPTLQKWTSPTVDTVLDNMLSALKKENRLKNIKDICKEFQNIEREFGIPEEKMNEIQRQFIRMTSNEDPSIRRAAVWALGQLNVHRDDAYLSLVRRLVDDDRDTREEATKVLKDLTDVETKEGLCRLLINTGVVHFHLPCNDNAVLLELADRLKLGKYRKEGNVTVVEEEDEKASSFSDLRTTLRRKPFKAKFKHPETMKYRLRGAPPRRHGILDRSPSLEETDKFKAILADSALGCKLLQNMESFRPDITHSQAPERAKDVVKNSLIGGASVSSQQPDQESRKDDDEMQRDKEGSDILASTSKQFSRGGKITQISILDWFSPFSKEGGIHIPAATSGRFSGRDTMMTIGRSIQKDHKTQCRAPSQRMSHRTQSKTSSRGLSQRTTELQSRMEPKDQKRQTLFHREGHTQYLTLTGILTVIGKTMGVNQSSAKLLLLKLKRTKRIIAKQISMDDNTIQSYYSVGDLVETCCNLPPLVDTLTTLARKAAKTKQEMRVSMRGLFHSELLSFTRKGDYVVINGLGRLPAEYHDDLQETRLEVFEKLKKCLENDELFSSSEVKMAKSFTSLLEHLLWFCAILEPEIKVLETTHTSGMETSSLTMHKTISQTHEISFSRKKTDEHAQPIFEQASLHLRLGPGNHGQRLLNSTLIRAKALSDSKLRTLKETQEFVVIPLPHRLSVHTGMKREGESHFGIMELTWRAGTPLPSSKTEACQKERASSLSELSGKPVQLEEHYRLKEKKQKSKSKIPKSKSVPPLSHCKVKPFAEKQLTLFQAVNSLNSKKRKDFLAGLIDYINNKNIIKKKFLDENGNLLPESFTDVPQPLHTATPFSVLISSSSTMRMINNGAMTSIKSGESSGRCSTFYDQARDLTRDTLLRDLDEFHLPPIWRLGGHHRRR
ncbi:uncharacterized protein LOC111326716 [Stylophora pistillata]|uniref:uncharacterized protein LOC111326716 n=1 Tax=Stylophora pistillata TaxID=50429 RepID=UPI000C0547A9|nr:uncharacterized protein LOC111326716 [Stylophora pistillata]